VVDPELPLPNVSKSSSESSLPFVDPNAKANGDLDDNFSFESFFGVLGFVGFVVIFFACLVTDTKGSIFGVFLGTSFDFGAENFRLDTGAGAPNMASNFSSALAIVSNFETFAGFSGGF